MKNPNGIARDCILSGESIPAGIAERVTELDLSYSQISDLSPIAGLTGLKTLYLFGTQVSDLSPIAGFTGLKTLGLTGTQVSDLSPIAGLTGLKSRI